MTREASRSVITGNKDMTGKQRRISPMLEIKIKTMDAIEMPE
jgi:hypothetical protein